MLPKLPCENCSRSDETLCEDSDSAGSETDLVVERGRESSSRRKRRGINIWNSRNTLTSSIIALVIGFSIGAAGASLLFYFNAGPACLPLQNAYSPVLQNIPAKYTSVRFNGTLDHPSEYRGPPSLSVDNAWDHMTKVKIISVSESDILKSGSTKDAIQIPEEFGGGYMATLEVTHQLHCLNFLRMASHWEYYQYKAVEFSDEPSMVRTHLDHCIEMLRQVLMCNADAGIISHRWVKGYTRPYPDFNVIHKCRDLDQVMSWSHHHEVPTPPGYQFKAPANARIFDSPP
ncbi:hypothetical protein NLU13_0938 [Sarocladium strictum]|uniref:Tat pathway signal sequence n=1 Tax=Sarocladium strictum TaxID=5046 RepID=A0AA39GSS8_SARSR|nr:hypothetical protein NLU13_0938 [Sarocladium strictum]